MFRLNQSSQGDWSLWTSHEFWTCLADKDISSIPVLLFIGESDLLPCTHQISSIISALNPALLTSSDQILQKA